MENNCKIDYIKYLNYLDKLNDLKDLCRDYYDNSDGDEKVFWIKHYHLLDNHHDMINEDCIVWE